MQPNEALPKKPQSARLALTFSCLGHAYMHLFTAFYFVIALSLEADWGIPNYELVKLWALGSLLVGLAALPAGWLGDRWSSSGMMTVFFTGLGISGIVCGLVDSTTALMFGLAAIGIVIAELDVSPAFSGFDGEKTVRSDATMAVAEQGDLLRGEVGVEITVVDHNEIVAGSVHLGKGEGHERVIVLIVRRCKRLRG